MGLRWGRADWGPGPWRLQSWRLLEPRCWYLPLPAGPAPSPRGPAGGRSLWSQLPGCSPAPRPREGLQVGMVGPASSKERQPLG